MEKKARKEPPTSPDVLLFDNRKYYTITQTANIWGVARRTIYNYMEKYPAITRRSIKRGGVIYLSGVALNSVYYGKPIKRQTT